MMSHLLLLSLALIALAVAGCVYRLLIGPSVSDRIAALDMIGVLLLSMIAIIGMLLKTYAYLDIILVIGILTFIGTTAFARYIERGVVIDSGDDERSR
ncbi:Na(+)/H(+) antiporter subunit F1 [Paenibacillus ginsengihumi]|uniref:Na(+)/H(+) antiporter subunit F1 n=1 Tax=Paenibacillus ginsengihumi TaxID=431596 RepID=UPI0003612558|nr:Na(+)/H(+) antiporter subunit F1 [Paenibacillus ginsengihumi]